MDNKPTNERFREVWSVDNKMIHTTNANTNTYNNKNHNNV